MESGFAQVLLEYTPDALLLLAPDGTISFLNAAAEDLFGYSRSELLGTDASLLLAAGSRQDFHRVLAALGSSAGRAGQSVAGAGQPFAGCGLRADGAEVAVEITCSALPPGANADSPSTRAGEGAADPGAPSGPAVALSVRGTMHRLGTPALPAAAGQAATRRPAATAAAAAPPASARRGAPPAFADREDRLRAGALRDQLTALPNANLFSERLAAALRRPDPVDVLLLNVDDLKTLSDLLGRSSADELLVEVASRLWNCVRPNDTVARLGGNEFVVLLTECLDPDAAARRISESVCGPLQVGRSVVQPGVSMGLASRTAETRDGAELLRQAAAALAAARAGGRHTWLRFRPEMLS